MDKKKKPLNEIEVIIEKEEIFDKELLSVDQITQLESIISEYENGNIPVMTLVQHWSGLPSKLDCGRFPEITKYLK